MTAKEKKTPQVYLFFGEESFLIAQKTSAVVNRLVGPAERDMNLISLNADPAVGELLHLTESAPFFGDHKVVLIHNSKLFQASRRKAAENDDSGDDEKAETENETETNETADSTDPRLLQLITNMPEYSTLIFTAMKADKRRKIFKLIAEKGQVQELNPFRPHEDREVKLWLEDLLTVQGKRMSRDAMDHLLAILSTMSQIPRSFLASEIDKAVLFAGKEPVISKSMLEAVMAAVPEISAFAMTDALARRSVSQALGRLEELFVGKEPPLKTVGLLAYNVRRWWQVRQIIDRQGTEAEMMAALGAKSGSSFMARRTISQSRAFRDSALKQALLTLAEANVAIRSGGDPRPFLERVIIELCQ
jgi:DNA polymerase-3 subunit delta